MILCDTSILIKFYKGNPSIILTLRTIEPANIDVSVTARDKRELAKIEHHLGLCHCYDLNPAISTLFIDLMRRYSLSHKASVPDMLIAATALSMM